MVPKTNTKYPRVLILYNSKINMVDQHGVSIREWFADWPKEHLAQIYSGGESGENTFCGSNFKIGEKERRFGNVFFKLKNSSLGQSSYPIFLQNKSAIQTQYSYWHQIKNKLSRALISTGFFEIIFKPKISNDMKLFIRNFNPNIIYCQGYSLTFSNLPLILHKKLNLPICFQTGDDWPKYPTEKFLLSFVISTLIRWSAKKLIKSSVIRLSNGDSMSELYLKRYNVQFVPMMMCDNYSRFKTASVCRLAEKSKVSIVYTGNLGSMRAASLLDLCNTVREINSDGDNVTITALVTSMPIQADNLLKNAPYLTILPAPAHEELVSYLKGADILFIPESFNERQARSIQLSISTKVHLYMMSERPVLIYGHKLTGTMNYANRINWACRVDKQDTKLLKSALKKLITDKTYCKQLIDRGIEVALQNHDSSITCEKFRKILFDNSKK
jgi:hypothetical protein